MPTEATSLVGIAAQYGVLGLIVLAMGAFIMYLLKQHREERKEMAQQQSGEHKETIDVIRNNTIALSELVTLIKNPPRR